MKFGNRRGSQVGHSQRTLDKVKLSWSLLIWQHQTSSGMDKTYFVVTTGCDKFYINIITHVSKKVISHTVLNNLYSQASLPLFFVEVCL